MFEIIKFCNENYFKFEISNLKIKVTHQFTGEKHEIDFIGKTFSSIENGFKKMILKELQKLKK